MKMYGVNTDLRVRNLKITHLIRDIEVIADRDRKRYSLYDNPEVLLREFLITPMWIVSGEVPEPEPYGESELWLLPDEVPPAVAEVLEGLDLGAKTHFRCAYGDYHGYFMDSEEALKEVGRRFHSWAMTRLDPGHVEEILTLSFLSMAFWGSPLLSAVNIAKDLDEVDPDTYQKYYRLRIQISAGMSCPSERLSTGINRSFDIDTFLRALDGDVVDFESPDSNEDREDALQKTILFMNKVIELVNPVAFAKAQSMSEV